MNELNLGPCPSCGISAHACRAPLLAEIESLRAQLAAINVPEIEDFERGVRIEASHQRARWGIEHDSGKTSTDWFWLVGYVAGKALHADIFGNSEKFKHHIITTAAVCANWHAYSIGAEKP